MNLRFWRPRRRPAPKPPVITTERVEQQIRRITALMNRLSYKPASSFRCRAGWTFDGVNYFEDTGPYVLLLVNVPVLNVQPPHEAIVITSCKAWFVLDIERLDDQFILGELFDVIVQAERHEVAEWFKFDGKNVVDPHPELQPRS